MAYEEKVKTAQKPHNVIMEERCRLTVSGVDDVDSFDEKEIVARTAKGNLVIRGSDLHIGKLSLDSGELKVEGVINDLTYEDTLQSSGGLWARLFK